MSDSEHKFNDELISAFLDGELSDTERALVEQALTEDAGCRRTWNDLRALRKTLQSLPAYQLGPDFHDKVLRQVDAAARESHDGTSEVPIQESAPLSAPDMPISRPMRYWRGTFWAIGTVAAAAVLLFMLNLPDPPNVAELARNDSKITESAGLEPDGADLTEPASEARPSLRQKAGPHEPKEEQLQEQSPALSDDAFGFAGADAIQMDVDADVALGDRTRKKAAPRAPRRTSDVGQEMVRTAEVPRPAASRPSIEPQHSGELAYEAHERLSRVAADRTSAEMIADAMQTTGAQYVVHLIVNRTDTSGEAFDRSLANNEIHYKKRTEPEGLAARALERSEAERISGVASDQRERFALPVEHDGASDLTTRGESPQLVVVNTTTTRLRDTVNELTQLRDEFSDVKLYEVASDDNATSNLKMGNKLRWMDLTMPVEGEQKGLGVAADQSGSANGALKTDRALSESVDAEAVDSLDEADEAGAASRSVLRRSRARGFGAEGYERRLDSRAANAQPESAMRRQMEPTRGAMTGGAGGAIAPSSDQPAVSPTDATEHGLQSSDLAKRIGAGLGRADDSVQVLFVLSPSVQPFGVTATEPAEAEIAPVEPVAEPDENR